ncbi:DNA polymerase [Marine Group I thaumarchaeote]|uniref:DNA polymerase n=1 Tax=Marine Group I thaumarchaeote TaxID=2511932 RepID=A0A7K4MWX4_9ARCH|nr:DNA polymerase [Marine Group I thaumarchaeote]
MFYTNVQPHGNFIALRGVNDRGESFKEKLNYEPTLFVESHKPQNPQWKTLDNRNVAPVKWGSMKESRQAMKEYGGNVFGFDQFQYSFISDNYRGMVDYDLDKIKIGYIDIETSSEHGFPDVRNANEEVLAISYRCGETFRVYGCQGYEPSEGVLFVPCTSEEHLLLEFVNDWSMNYPDIITGWNSRFFDIPYLVNRIVKILGQKMANKLSPWGWYKENEINLFGNRKQQVFELVGISSIDYMDVYKKFTYVNRESYSLNHIAYTELGEKKLDYSEYSSLHELYKTNFQKFVDYNVRDVVLLERLEEKLKLLEMIISLAYMAKCNFNDVFSPVKMWDCIIFNHLKDQQIVVPPKKHETKTEAYEGAYVKDPQIGRHKWVASFDLNSLYPHLIMQYNISPETLVGMHTESGLVDALLDKEFDVAFLKEKNLTMTPNGSLYTRKKQGFLPALMEKMYTDRVKYKNLLLTEQKKGKAADTNKLAQYHNMQINLKIALNSAYGALGNQWFRFYDVRNAEAVSVAGQLSIRWAERAVNQYLNKILETENDDYVLASDTDSLYVTLDSLVQKVGLTDTDKIIEFMDKVCEGKIQNVIDKCYGEMAEYVNAFEQKMVMKREVLAEVGIWTGKKHYILNVHNSEGVQYDEPKLKIMGIEAIKSSTPEPCRNALKEAFKIMMNGTEDDVINYIEDFKIKFKTLPAEEVSFPRSVKGLAKYHDSASIYQKSTPIHVKGSLIYNKILQNKRLTRKYPKIQEGEKIKFAYLKEPNPTGDTVIAMLNALPDEFELKPYIDYEKQFSKSFLDPIIGILNVIGWEHERKTNIMGFFT